MANDPQVPNHNSQETSDHVEVRVELPQRSYSIQIGAGATQNLGQSVCRALPKANHAVCIYDASVRTIHDDIVAQLNQENFRVTSLEVPSGEASKSVAMCEKLWQSMLAEHTDRGSVVIAIGGGVVGDLAGFMAASFARGIPLVQVPTTLLSQVDSSVGGKTGINLPGAKNIVGAFWQPSLVCIDTDSLDSLPQREYLSGLAEVAKYGVIMLPELFRYLQEHASQAVAKSKPTVAHIIAESCRAKAQVVQEDERETSGRRAILNYGHTFAHALESTTGYGTLLHGEAVSIGMHMAATLACHLERVNQDFVDEQKLLLESLQLPTRYEAPPEKLWDVMQHDKKVEHGKLRFILPTALGHVELVPDIKRPDVLQAIEASNC